MVFHVHAAICRQEHPDTALPGVDHEPEVDLADEVDLLLDAEAFDPMALDGHVRVGAHEGHGLPGCRGKPHAPRLAAAADGDLGLHHPGAGAWRHDVVMRGPG